jgi:hypothetical protein
VGVAEYAVKIYDMPPKKSTEKISDSGVKTEGSFEGIRKSEGNLEI